jgi:hypothetical protein
MTRPGTPQPTVYIGTYLYPLLFLAPPDSHGKSSGTEIIDTIASHEGEIVVTRMGGLFTPIPPALLGRVWTTEHHLVWNHLQAQLDFEQSTCRVFNLLACELCTWGRVVEPASPAFLAIGQISNGKLDVQQFEGAEVPYFDRILYPAAARRDDDVFLVASLRTDPDVLGKSRSLATAKMLAEVSPSLPTFVAAAYSLYSQHRFAEAIIDAWIVCEQMIDGIWERFRKGINGRARQKRLDDNRTFSMAVRLELLFSEGLLREAQYEAFQVARKHRNDLAHRARIGAFAARETVNCLRMLLSDLAGREVADFPEPSGPMWGSPGPDRTVEP